MSFELVKNYLYLIHKVNGLEPVSLLPEDMTVQDQEDDSFLKYYGSITNFVGFPIPLVALSAHIE